MEKSNQLKLNLQYVSMQVPYWMGYSVLGTFTSVFLLSRDFTNGQIGTVLSLANLVATVVQPFLASFADRMTRIRLSQLAAGMALLLVLFSSILLVLPKAFLVIAFIYILLYTCLVLLQPLTIAIGTFFISRGYALNFGVGTWLFGFCGSSGNHWSFDRTVFCNDYPISFNRNFSFLCTCNIND